MRAYHSAPRSPDVSHLVDDRAEDEPEPEQAGAPAKQSRALQSPDEPERAVEARRGLGASGSLREDAAADVAPGREHGRRANENEKGECEEAERPPVVAAERAHLLAPPHRGQPRRPGARKPKAARVDAAEHVPHAADHEREPEDRGGETGRSARGRRELHGDGRDSGEHDAEGADRHSGGRTTPPPAARSRSRPRSARRPGRRWRRP